MLVFLIILVCVCKSTASKVNQVVDFLPKSVTYIRQSPSTVMVILANPQFDVRCTGSLLSPEWVLTAARCVFLSPKCMIHSKYMKVFAGYNNAREYLNTETPSSEAQQRDVSEIHVHPYYVCCEYDESNVALLKVKTSFTMFSMVGTTSLATRPLEPGRDHDCLVTGFGREESDTIRSTDSSRDTEQLYWNCAAKLRTVTVRRRCACEFKGRGKSHSQLVRAPLICDNNNKGDTIKKYAFADLGAGLTCDGKLQGVFGGSLNRSFYETCGRRTMEDLTEAFSNKASGAHTDVFSSTCLHLRWINKITNIMSWEDVHAYSCGKLSRRYSKYSLTRKNKRYLYPGGDGATVLAPAAPTLALLITSLLYLH